jgi:hypothetical protein
LFQRIPRETQFRAEAEANNWIVGYGYGYGYGGGLFYIQVHGYGDGFFSFFFRIATELIQTFSQFHGHGQLIWKVEIKDGPAQP